MKKHLLSCFLIAMLATAFCLSPISHAVVISSEEEAQTILNRINGTQIANWQSFYDNAYANNSTYTSVTKTPLENDAYESVIEIETVSLKEGNSSACAANYYSQIQPDDIHEGDSVLIRVVARGLPCSGNETGFTEGSFSLSLYKDSSNPAPGFQTKQTAPQEWTVYYVAGTGVEGADRINIRIGYQMQRIQIADFEVINCGQTPLSELPTGNFPLSGAESGQIYSFSTLYDELETSVVSTGLEEYPYAKSLPSPITATFSADDSSTFGENDILLFSFVLKAENACTKTQIQILSNDALLSDMTYPVPVQWTRIDMPVRAAELKSVNFSHDGEILIADISLTNKGETTFEALSLQSGMHMIDDYRAISLPENGIGAGKTIDFVQSGNYLYSIGNEKLTVSNVTDPENPVVEGTLDSLGSVLQIALCASGTDVIVTARQNGAYIIDVSDPKHPRIRYAYDTIEFATGVYVCGDYAYIACRVFGVEIVDISDLDNPKHCSIVRCGEAQSCQVAGGRLYVGLWGECRVDIYDVVQPSEPKLLGRVSLSGRGDGMKAVQIGEKTVLFAATGQHTEDLPIATQLSDLRYGQGNGMDIYDVTTPSSPIWLSTVRTDGRCYYPGNDFWETETAVDKDGHLLVYLTSTYNGVYVYNADNLCAPVRLAHITLPIYPGSPLYQKLSFAGRAIIFPFDQDELIQIPVGALAVDENQFYIAGVGSDLHVFSTPDLAGIAQEDESAVLCEEDNGTFYDFDSSKRNDFASFHPGGQVYAAAVYEDRIYAACGEDGIYVLDSNLQVLEQVHTTGFSYDVRIQNGILYSAEGKGGFAAYDISERLPVKQWSLLTGSNVRQVRLSPKARFAVLQIDGSQVKMINLETKQTVVQKSTSGLMYFRNLSNSLVAGRYIGFYGNSSQTFWYDFGMNDDYDTPILVNDRFATSTIDMAGGYDAAGDLALGTRSGGYVLYDPTDTTISAMNELTLHRGNGSFSGKPSVHGDLLVTTDRIKGNIFLVDISDLTNPVLKETISVSGNPDVAVITDDTILIPLGRQGLIKFRPAMAEADISVSIKDEKVNVHIASMTCVTPRSYTVICAVYDGNSLVSSNIVESGEFAFDRPVNLSFEEPKNMVYKVFVWENTESLRPLCPAFSNQSQ